MNGLRLRRRHRRQAALCRIGAMQQCRAAHWQGVRAKSSSQMRRASFAASYAAAGGPHRAQAHKPCGQFCRRESLASCNSSSPDLRPGRPHIALLTPSSSQHRAHGHPRWPACRLRLARRGAPLRAQIRFGCGSFSARAFSRVERLRLGIELLRAHCKSPSARLALVGAIVPIVWLSSSHHRSARLAEARYCGGNNSGS